ncbi:MAG: hypothetical protein L6R36_005612 [Xanthoria steineri]|nr:MAG: hypothetical protein L6R36_005612 [Xanthoria steineri]
MDFWRLIGFAQTSFYSHQESLPLRTKASKTTTLLDLCKSVTPPCWMNPLLFNCHLQTCWTALTRQNPLVYYKRAILTAEDPAFEGTFTVDFVVPPFEDVDPALPPRTTYVTQDVLESLGKDDDRPMLVMLHGLSGGSHEVYLRHVLDPLFKDGWEACVVNARGCARSKITSDFLFNARATWDIRQVVKWLREIFPRRPLFGIGFSLGGNILVNYLGEEGCHCLLQAAVVCSNPWNLDVASIGLQNSWLGLHLYSRAMGANLKNLFELHVKQMSRNPRINIDKVRSITYLHEFDRELQCSTWGYPTEGAYYRDASSCDALLAVRIPLFAIHAEDDPVAVKEAVPYQEIQHNAFTVLCTTRLGGHLGWFESGAGRWFAKPAIQFLKEMAFTIDPAGCRHERHIRASQEEKSSNGDRAFDPMRRRLRTHAP